MPHETLGACPVCRSPVRSVLHEGLVDDTFHAIDGHWTLWRCAACAVAYLDPRPDRSDIVQAYRRYYTHASTAGAPSLSWRGRIRERMERAYVHRRFGFERPTGSAFWGRVYALLPLYRSMTDAQFRHLPGPGGGRTLLDVGCGNGRFLQLAQACGWQAEGVDPDPAAAAGAQRHGLRVHEGGLERYDGEAACFDVITLSHVIEHVHDPVAALSACHRLLRPGGRLWLATPNVDSGGHARFGRHWRGLEAPRHLVLFNEGSLRQALKAAGFHDCAKLPPHPYDTLVMVRSSHGLVQGMAADGPPVRLSMRMRVAAARMTWIAWRRPASREFLYLTATR